MANVFLSYVSKDRGKAKSIAHALQKAGHPVWWDRHIKGGSEFSKEIEQALERAEAVVVLWSIDSIESAWVRDEAVVGRDSGRLVPVRIDQSLPPLGFRQYQTIDFGSAKIRSESTGMRALLHGIAGLAKGPNQQDDPFAPSPVVIETRRRWLTRRSVAAGLLTAGAAAAGFLLLRDRDAPVSSEVAALMAQAWQAWTQGTNEGSNQAIGLYRRITDLAPNHADAWGFLACAYADRAHLWSITAERSDLRERAREAARRALELDAKNAYGRAAMVYAQPIVGNWLSMEQEFRRAIRDQPEKWLVSYSLALLLTRVGRVSEAAKLFGTLRWNAPTAIQYYFHTQALWAFGQLDQADKLLDEATAIYKTHPIIWFSRLQILLHGSRGGAALALVQDEGSRPSFVSEQTLSEILAVVQATLSRDQADTDSAMATLMQRAHESAWQAEMAIQFACALQRVDEAFAIADAFYFSRGFVVPDEARSASRAVEATLDARDTRFLFLPSVRAMRADTRFERLVDDIGLARFWRETGVPPDYLRS
jgi:tetratricopeptide (TPR) repeat protein